MNARLPCTVSSADRIAGRQRAAVDGGVADGAVAAERAAGIHRHPPTTAIEPFTDSVPPSTWSAPRIGVGRGQDRGAGLDAHRSRARAAAGDDRGEDIVRGGVVEHDLAGAIAEIDRGCIERAGRGGRLTGGGADVQRAGRAGLPGDRQGRSRDAAAVADGQRAGAEMADSETGTIGPGRAGAIHRRGAGRAGSMPRVPKPLLTAPPLRMVSVPSPE